MAYQYRCQVCDAFLDPQSWDADKGGFVCRECGAVSTPPTEEASPQRASPPSEGSPAPETPAADTDAETT